MDGFDWSRYAVGGAASRADSFTGLNQDYASRVAAMMTAAEAELGPGALKITSAYRSPELQAQLYEAAIAKYGSPEAARKWVAPPGKSKHNAGLAVDFAGPDGGLLRDANSREAQWIAQNASRFGLDVPMSWEPWQVELAGSRDGSATNAMGQTYSMGQPVTQPQNALAAQPQAPEQPRMVDLRQDPAAFMRPQNALAMQPTIVPQRYNSLARFT